MWTLLQRRSGIKNVGNHSVAKLPFMGACFMHTMLIHHFQILFTSTGILCSQNGLEINGFLVCRMPTCAALVVSSSQDHSVKSCANESPQEDTHTRPKKADCTLCLVGGTAFRRDQRRQGSCETDRSPNAKAADPGQCRSHT